MRKELIEAETREEAEERAPWACGFIEIGGGCNGWLGFESPADYEEWFHQWHRTTLVVRRGDASNIA